MSYQADSFCAIWYVKEIVFYSPQVKRTKTARTFHNSTKAYHGREITSTHTNRDINKVHVVKQDVLSNSNLKCISVSSTSEIIFHTTSSTKKRHKEMKLLHHVWPHRSPLFLHCLWNRSIHLQDEEKCWDFKIFLPGPKWRVWNSDSHLLGVCVRICASCVLSRWRVKM